MNDIELLQKLFEGKLIKSEEGDYGRPCIKLKESNLYSITIANVPQNAIAIKTDSFPDLRNFFNCSSDIGNCKRADFVIIIDKKLIFIELSQGTKQTKHVLQQLKGAQCVIEYCRSISNEFYGYSSFLTGYTTYCVSVSGIADSKRPNILLSNDANSFLKIKSPNNNSIPFSKLCQTKPTQA